MPIINATFIEAFTIDGGRVSETKGRDLNPILEPKIFPFLSEPPTSAACRQLIMSIMCRIYVIPLLVTLVAVDYISPPSMMVIE